MRRGVARAAVLSVALLVGLGLSTTGQTQSTRGPRSLSDRFEANAPAVGDPFPDVTAYDGTARPSR
ncbi:MAG: hypothetical protein ACE5IK_00110 [Acidobacteriota bacterium]